ncbi:MAG: CRISPR-associated helicase Cas3' [Anaerolineae bacterium]|nr:CRISPR-associated helicase Cas3' [Anaerolineae bacterium]
MGSSNSGRRPVALDKANPIPTYQLLWAKTSKDKTQTHPLICHMIDVAQVTLALWNEVLTDSIRRQFADSLGLDVDAAGRLVAFWTGLHDLGKASPCFQGKYGPAKALLAGEGLSFPSVFASESCPHGTISAEVLQTLLETETGLPHHLGRRVARAVGGHHGAWPHPQELQALKSSQMGSESWEVVRSDLLQVMLSLFYPPVVERLGATLEEENAVVMLLSGLTSAADWLGSMERYSPYVAAPVNPRRYAERAATHARQALKELGWIGWEPPRDPIVFQDLFLFPPRPMQQVVVNLAERLDQPALVIIEAPTGTGKTEAALYLADHWARVCQQRGLYVAMPTMATSNQMLGRVQEVLRRRYPQNLVNLHLIHSQAQWRDDMQALRLETFDERQGGTVAAMAWFLPRKRGLLAPFGVGTVDQALLSVLQARHFFVRLFGLSHKTVIFDEVHAYDTYMSTIFQRLLDWLRAMGTSVVILSATLPKQTRRALLRAYTGSPDIPVPDVSYPAITWATEDQVGVLPLEASTQRTVAVEWIEREPEAIAHRLAAELRDGGCAAVICNTVRRAQEVYRAIRDTRIVPPEDLILFHARFPFAWREQIERKVLERFDKKDQRPHKAVVVATQVIEQSLDLDFDLMVTDLAPVDLILQRAGRLHRHQRETRPTSCATPRLLITTPANKNSVPDFERDIYVYERYVLLRSYLALQGCEQIALPDETEALIEAVYADETPSHDDTTPAFASALKEAWQQMQRHGREEQDQARSRLIAEPQNRRLMNATEVWLEEDKPELHRTLQALTRLIPPGVSLVCLHQTADGLALEPDGEPCVDLAQPPAWELTPRLAQYTITATHRPVVDHFLAQAVPTGWRDHPLLHNHRAAIFTEGVCTLDGTPYMLRLSREFGLEIEKEAE